MARSAHYEGGLNTITRVFPAGTTGTIQLLGVAPKRGYITRVLLHGQGPETFTVRLRNSDVAGQALAHFTVSTPIVWGSNIAARAGTELVFEPDNALRELKDRYQVLVDFTAGTLVTPVAVIVNFEPR